jgi:uncharacterized protein DUF5677
MIMNSKGIPNILESLERPVTDQTGGRLEYDGHFACALKAGLAKNYELNRVIFDDENPTNPFALTATLRGLCEDIIGLKYIRTFDPSDRNEAIVLLITESTFDFIEKQKTFFTLFRPQQRILGRDNAAEEAKEKRQVLANFKQKYGWTSRQDWPTIREMAETTGLLPLYDYLYAVTSSFVHFSPRNLARMGWGVTQRTLRFSTSNFAEYYDTFNQFYGVFLFITFCTSFCSLLGCKEEFRLPVTKLIEILDAETRWPELVTWEEMNMASRKSLSQMLFYVGLMYRC